MKTTGLILGMAIAMLVFAPMGNAVTLGDPNVVINGHLNVDNAVLYVDNLNNRIGIGMTNPARDFHLRKFSSGFVDFLHQNNGSGPARFIVQSAARQWIWTAGADGGYSLFGTGGAGNVMFANSVGNLGLGGQINPTVAVDIVGDLKVSGTGTVAILEITGGSDLSEQFQIASDGLEVIPGMVVSIDAQRPGELTVSSKAYDRAVAGIVSGAGGLNTGLLMGQQGTDLANGDFPVALTGRVYVYVDAAFGAVTPGDLLTTSPTAGHAMVVKDHAQAQGAMIGKAMTPLAAGQKGLVLVLVSLQ